MSLTAMITPPSVREVINTSLTDAELNGLIAAAETLVKSRLSGVFVDADVQVEIVRWVAAHFVSIRGSQTTVTSSSATIKEEKLGDAKVKYGTSERNSSISNNKLSSLKSTFWGQTAISFDPTGSLDNLGGKPPRVVALTGSCSN